MFNNFKNTSNLIKTETFNSEELLNENKELDLKNSEIEFREFNVKNY